MLPLVTIPGGYQVSFLGVPNFTYTLQRATNVSGGPLIGVAHIDQRDGTMPERFHEIRGRDLRDLRQRTRRGVSPRGDDRGIEARGDPIEADEAFWFGIRSEVIGRT